MAVEYKIKLTPPGETNAESGKSTREVELLILKQTFEMAAAKEKDLRVMNCCIDCVEQIENIADNAEHVALTKDDIDRFKAGHAIITASPSGVPAGWLRQGRRIYTQMESPSSNEASTTD